MRAIFAIHRVIENHVLEYQGYALFSPHTKIKQCAHSGQCIDCFIGPTAVSVEIIFKKWGCSSVGRASRSQCEGQEFDPPQLHKIWNCDSFEGMLVRIIKKGFSFENPFFNQSRYTYIIKSISRYLGNCHISSGMSVSSSSTWRRMCCICSLTSW